MGKRKRQGFRFHRDRAAERTNLRPEPELQESRARRGGPPVPPAEYTKGAESVPAAGRAEMLKLKVRFPSVGVLQGPAAIFEPAVVDDFDGLGKAWIARGVDGLKIIKCAENVLVPSGRKRKTSEFRLDDFAGAVGAKEAVEQQELTATILRGA